MCGIAGILPAGPVPVTAALSQVRRMLALLRHRGPDDEGYVSLAADTGRSDEYIGDCSPSALRGRLRHVADASGPDNCRLALGHVRLSIIDLSEHGHQPMTNEDRTLWVVYNGEIYNFPELRDQLASLGHRFTSQTDTEVILHAYETWGQDCLARFNGMFAFTLWDSVRQQLFCARDRFGIKPFYYCHDREGFAFASEIKALLDGHPERGTADRETVARFLAYGYQDLSAATFLAPVRQLAPAHSLVVADGQVQVTAYWRPSPARAEQLPERAVAERFREKFLQAVARHLRADVPVGFCLSGGLDSSSIVTAAYSLGGGHPADKREQIHTFSSCFADPRYDERPYIDEVVRGRAITPHQVFPQAADFLADWEKLLWHQDEPFPTMSIFAQWRVMQRVRAEGVTVLLDGQGGDELLAGYVQFWVAYFRDLAGAGQWGRLVHELRQARQGNLGATRGFAPLRLVKNFIKELLPAWALSGWDRRTIPQRFPWLNAALAYIPPLPPDFIDDGDAVQQMSAQHLLWYPLPALLHFEDRNSMAFSLESRVPFLDLDLAEYAFAQPGRYKMGDGLTKKMLREGLRDLLPAKIAARRDKMGFVTPGEASWLTGELRPWVRGIVESDTFRQRPCWDSRTVAGWATGVAAGQEGTGPALWRCVNLELWLRLFRVSL